MTKFSIDGSPFQYIWSVYEPIDPYCLSNSYHLERLTSLELFTLRVKVVEDLPGLLAMTKSVTFCMKMRPLS